MGVRELLWDRVFKSEFIFCYFKKKRFLFYIFKDNKENDRIFFYVIKDFYLY